MTGCEPVGAFDGTRKFTWFSPGNPGARPENCTVALTPPTVTATVNGIDPTRATGLVVPPSGFTIDVAVSDGANQWPDVGNVELLLVTGAAGVGKSSLARELHKATAIQRGAAPDPHGWMTALHTP